MSEARIWVRIKLRALFSAIRALKSRSMQLHDDASKESDELRSKLKRREADIADEDGEEFKRALRRFESGEDVK